MHDALEDEPGHALVRDHTVYACVTGLRAFGLADAGGPVVRRGVFAAPAPLFWRLDKPPAHVVGPRPDEASWELERFCTLALRGHLGVLECLHSPLVEHADATGRELLGLRDAFLSRRVDASLRAQAARLLSTAEAAIRDHGVPRWGAALHLLRVLTCCRDTLRTGRMDIDAGAQRDRLLAVGRGEVPWAQVRSWVRDLHEECDREVARTPLPEAPDRDRVEDFLVRARALSAAPLASHPV
jgi:hypothetical protein